MHHLLCFTWLVGSNLLLDHSRDDIPELVGCMRHTPAISLITHFLFPIILMDDILYSKKREKEMLQSQEEWDDGSCSEWMNEWIWRDKFLLFYIQITQLVEHLAVWRKHSLPEDVDRVLERTFHTISLIPFRDISCCSRQNPLW